MVHPSHVVIRAALAFAALAGADATAAQRLPLPTGGQPLCGNARVDAGEECDDANAVDTDGCTSACRIARICSTSGFSGGDAFAVDPPGGHCYVRYSSELLPFDLAQSNCRGDAGHLVSITSQSEQDLVAGLLAGGETYWIGAIDDANDMDAVFAWLTGEAWGYTAFAGGEPDDDVAVNGLGECLAIASAGWFDTDCNLGGFIGGQVCEYDESMLIDGFE